MAGLRNIWVSESEVVATNPTGQITGFTETVWRKLEVFQNQASYTVVISKAEGGIRYNTTVDYPLGSLRNSSLRLVEELLESYGYSLVVETSDKTGLFLSPEGWSSRPTTTDSGNIITFQTTSKYGARSLTPSFFERFSNPTEPIDDRLLIQGDPVTIQGSPITIQ